MAYIVYMATCSVSRKSYIGMTGHTMAHRRAVHYMRAKNGETSCPRFWAAIRKYGRETFSWCELWKGKTKTEAEEKEIYFIKFFKPAYNVDAGGRAGAKGRIPHNRKTVLCLSDGKFYRSATAAAKAYGVACSDISSACRGEQQRSTAAGYYFIYSDVRLDYESCLSLIERIKTAIAVRRRRKPTRQHHPMRTRNGRDILGRSAAGPLKNIRPVICIDDGKRFNSAGEAAKYYDVALTSVRELCLGKNGRRTAGGKQFIYEDRKH